MPSTGEPGTGAEARKSPLSLPRALTDTWRPVIVGTSVWFLLFCALLVARYAFAAQPGVWLWTALSGWLLGLMGMSVMAWQRSSSRRGSRGAQQGI